MYQNFASFIDLVNPGKGSGMLMLALLMLILAWLSCYITTKLIYRTNFVIGKFKRGMDETLVRYIIRIKNLVIFIVIAIFYLSLVPSLRTLMSAMLAGAGITALVVGFAAKSTLSNIIAGLAMAIYRPIRIGDKLHLDGEFSTVEDITLRHTIVRTWQDNRLIIPNSKLDEMTITNYSIIDPKIKCTVDFGVSYDTDLDLTRRVVLETASQCPMLKKGEEEPWIRVTSHGDFSIGLRLYLWVKNIDDSYQARYWLLEQIKKRFDKEGIEIPFPYRTLVYKKDLPLPPKEKQLADDHHE